MLFLTNRKQNRKYEVISLRELMVNTVYYCGIRPLQVLKVISQVHMAKIRFLDTQEETFLDISGIREIPSTDKYITINC